MECIERIFYRKINPSDFKKLYDIDKPEGGGGQTYLKPLVFQMKKSLISFPMRRLQTVLCQMKQGLFIHSMPMFWAIQRVNVRL